MRTTVRRLSLAVLAAALLALLLASFALVPATATGAAACSIGATDYEESALRNASRSELLLIGTVTQERSMGQIGSSTLYESVVTPEVMLKGEAPDEPVAIPFLGRLGGDCSGGPRLQEGERVLLPIHWAYTGRSGDGSVEYAWRLTGIFSKVALEDGVAVLKWASGGSLVLGDSETVVRSYGSAVGADPRRIEEAVAAALAASHDGDSGASWRIVAFAGIVLVIAGLVMAAVRSRQPPSDAG